MNINSDESQILNVPQIYIYGVIHYFLEGSKWQYSPEIWSQITGV